MQDTQMHDPNPYIPLCLVWLYGPPNTLGERKQEMAVRVCFRHSRPHHCALSKFAEMTTCWSTTSGSTCMCGTARTAGCMLILEKPNLFRGLPEDQSPTHSHQSQGGCWAKGEGYPYP